MCTPNTEIQFCTCLEGDIFKNKDIYIWSLNRFIGYKEKNPDFFATFVKPTEDFQNGISAENINSKLNAQNIFDFDYTPQERDTLYISFHAKNRREFKSFNLIFRDGIWQTGRNPHYVSIEKNIARGEIKVNYKDENSFIKHCEELKSTYGITIPESIKVKCANEKEDSQDPIYHAIKNFKGYKVLYTYSFIEYAVESYFKTYPDENSERLQNIVNEAQNKFSLLERKFNSVEENFDFLNKCFEDLNKNIDDCFFIAIPFENGEKYLITNGRLIGALGGKTKRKNNYFENHGQKIKFEDFELLRN